MHKKRKELTGEEISKWNSNELLEEISKEGVPCAPLLDRMELMDHEQITANETIWYDNFDGWTNKAGTPSSTRLVKLKVKL